MLHLTRDFRSPDRDGIEKVLRWLGGGMHPGSPFPTIHTPRNERRMVDQRRASMGMTGTSRLVDLPGWIRSTSSYLPSTERIPVMTNGEIGARVPWSCRGPNSPCATYSSSASGCRMVAGAGISRVVPWTTSRRLFVGFWLLAALLGRMSRAGKPHENGLLGRRMALSTVLLTRVDRVLVVEAAAHRISFDNLIAHPVLFRVISRSCNDRTIK